MKIQPRCYSCLPETLPHMSQQRAPRLEPSPYLTRSSSDFHCVYNVLVTGGGPRLSQPSAPQPGPPWQHLPFHEVHMVPLLFAVATRTQGFGKMCTLNRVKQPVLQLLLNRKTGTPSLLSKNWRIALAVLKAHLAWTVSFSGYGFINPGVREKGRFNYEGRKG